MSKKIIQNEDTEKREELINNENNTQNIGNDINTEAETKNYFKKYWYFLLVVFVVAAVIIIVAFMAKKNSASDAVEDHVVVGQYKGLTYTPIDTSVSDEEVQAEIQKVVDNKTKYEKLDDRTGTTAVDGDIVNCTYSATLNGEVIEEGTGNFEIGSGEFSEFEDAIKGKVIGDSITVVATIPEDYAGSTALKDVAGAEVSFEVTLNFVSQRIVPEITDDFVSEVTKNECKSADDYADYVRSTLEEENIEEADAQISQELIEKIIDSSEFIDIDDMVQEYYDTMYSTYEDAAKAYDLGMEDYIQEYYSISLEEFKNQLSEAMNDLVKEQLVLKSIVQSEGLTITDEIYQKYIAEYLDDYGYTDEASFLEYYGEDSVKESMLYDYAIDYVVENSVADTSAEADPVKDDSAINNDEADGSDKNED
jgi:trigger factor